MHIKYIFSFLLLFYLSGCEQRILSDIQRTKDNLIIPYGTEQSFDLATWNLEHFPKQGTETISVLSSIIRKIDLDLIAFQEIDDVDAFYSLLDSLSGYGGFTSRLPQSSLKLGLIYKQEIITVTRPVQIFIADNHHFPRPPMVCYVSVNLSNDRSFNFFLVIVHLKAFSDEDSFRRRKTACLILKSYMDTYLVSSEESDLILLGDFNDDPLDAPPNNIFAAFINDSLHYHILHTGTRDLPTYFADQNSWIDHIVIRKSCLSQCNIEFVGAIPLDDALPYYRSQLSDHRPVLARFFPQGQ